MKTKFVFLVVFLSATAATVWAASGISASVANLSGITAASDTTGKLNDRLSGLVGLKFALEIILVMAVALSGVWWAWGGNRKESSPR